MPPSRSPASSLVKAWLTGRDGLATRLRAARIGAGYRSGASLAEAIGWQQSKVSRLETGTTPPTPADVEAWADACRLRQGARRELMRMATEAQARQYNFVATLDQAEHQATMQAVHREADQVTVFDSVVVPGPLQTERYALAVLEAWARVLPSDSATLVEGAARRAAQWAEVAAGKPHQVIVAESALAWAYGGPAVMAEQLDRVAAAGELDTVELQVIPFGVITTPIGLGFTLYGDDLASWEHWTGNGVDTVEKFGSIVEVLIDAAADRADSLAIVRRWADQHREAGQ